VTQGTPTRATAIETPWNGSRAICVFRTVDSTLDDIRFALRSFRCAPLAAFTIVATIATGLGVVAVLFTILNMVLFRTDAVPDVDELYAVQLPQAVSSESPLFTPAAFEAFRRETSVFQDVYAAISDINVRVDGAMMSATLVTGNFLDVVRVNPQMGRLLGAKDDQIGADRVIVLSDRGWSRHFDRDPSVVGRTVHIGAVSFEIVAVMPAGFRGLQVKAPDFWAPLSQVEILRPASRGNEGRVAVDVIGRLKPNVGVEAARTRIAAWMTHERADAGERRAEIIELQPRRGTTPRPMEALAVFTPLFFVFGLVLMIGCANVANLLLARGVARQREIGIRLSLGASRPRIIRQLLTESGLLALVAAAAGYVLSRVALTSLVYFFSRAMPVDLGDVNFDVATPAGDWRVAVFLVIAAGVATAFFALLPALRATRVQPVRTMRGLIDRGRPGRARNVLIGAQVFASALLLICAAIFLRSAIASSRFDPGFRTSDTVIVQMVNESTRVAMAAGIDSDPTIAAYAAVRPNTLQGSYGGVAATARNRTPLTYKFVSPEYFDVFGIPIVRGRSFTLAERDEDQPVVVVAESLARKMWPDRSGIGETFRIEPSADSSWRSDATTAGRLVTVVGISRDAAFRFMDANADSIFLPTSINAPDTSVVARVVGDPDVARRTLLERLTRIDPNMGLIVTMRTVARLERFFLDIAFWVSLVLGGLALLLTVSGLFSVLSYLVEQRTKEIGIRIALGASSQNVTRFMLAQTTRPVGYGLLAGTGLAASLATVLIASPAAGPIAQIVRVTDPVAYLTSLLSIVAACLVAAWIPAARAARLDPKQTLKHE
jgi:predicted permease